MRSLVILPILLFLSGSVAAGTSLPDCQNEFEPAPGGYSFAKGNDKQSNIPEGSKIGQIHYTRLQIFDESDPRENN